MTNYGSPQWRGKGPRKHWCFTGLLCSSSMFRKCPTPSWPPLQPLPYPFSQRSSKVADDTYNPDSWFDIPFHFQASTRSWPHILPMIYNGCHRAGHGAASPHTPRLSAKQMQHHELCNLSWCDLLPKPEVLTLDILFGLCPPCLCVRQLLFMGKKCGIWETGWEAYKVTLGPSVFSFSNTSLHMRAPQDWYGLFSHWNMLCPAFTEPG